MDTTHAMISLFLETRLALVKRKAIEAVNSKAITMKDLAHEATVNYYKRTPVADQDTPLRIPHPTDGEQYEADRVHNAQNLKRMLAGDQPFRIDFEESLVLALPEILRDETLHELSARYGLLAVKPRDPTDAMGSLSELLDEFGQFLKKYGLIAADGSVDERDAEHIPGALTEVSHVKSKLAGIEVMLLNALSASNVTPITAAKAKA